MKKSKLFFFAAIIGAISAAALILYLMRDQLRENPFFSRFMNQDDPTDYDYEEEDSYSFEEAEEAETEEEEPAIREVKPKVRRGYIPLRFHEAN